LLPSRAAFELAELSPTAPAGIPVARVDAVDLPTDDGPARLWQREPDCPWRPLYPVVGDDATFRLHTHWHSAAGCVRIDGVLTADDEGEHACLLRFAVPWACGPDMQWWNRIGEVCPVDPRRSYRQTFVPIAALCAGDAGLAAAIPPDAPCYFAAGYDGSVGLSMTMRLGLSPRTQTGANRASFSLLLMSTDGRWGLRDALRRYYDLFPDYYTRRTESYGLWFIGRAEAYPQPEVLAFDEVGNDFESAVGNDYLKARAAVDSQRGILTFPYTIVGVRHVIQRPRHPNGPEDAETLLNHPPAEFSQWHLDCMARAGCTDVWDILTTVLDAAARDREGRLCTVSRDIERFLGRTISVVCNPSPFLGDDCEGRRWLAYAQAAIDCDDVDGVYVDSLGRWCDYFDYHPDHLAAARVGLSFLDDGRVGQPNKLAHYEFLAALREILHRRGRLAFGNGLHHGGLRDGRFFLAALLDVAGCESGPATTLERYDFCRTCMGPKPYLLYSQGRWGRREQVERCFRYATLFGIAPSFFPLYYLREDQLDLDETHRARDPDEPDLPAGAYYRDQDIHERYLPVICRLHAAGWEPVTLVTASDEYLRIERFGRPGEKGEILLAVLNPTDEAIDFTLQTEPALEMGQDAGFQPVLDAARPVPRGRWMLRPDEVEVFHVTRADE
jgi:hypothetical protein